LEKIEIRNRHITVPNVAILVLIKFSIRGRLRFLSHAETVKLFQRACVRAGIKIRHRQGFNPRPKLSLPLPRSVGVETDDDLLCLRVAACAPEEDSLFCEGSPERELDKRLESRIASFDTEQFKARLSEQLPEDCKLLSVRAAGAKTSFQPISAVYVFEVRQEYLTEMLNMRIKRLLTSEILILERIDAKKSRLKNVDVRPFLKAIELDDKVITVECKISLAGSIRVEEILRLLELDAEKLAAPVRRTRVQWQEKNKC